MRESTIDHIFKQKVIAIVRAVDPTQLTKLVEAFIKGGITLVELTFNQKDPSSWGETCSSIHMLANRYKERILVGAGTVLTPHQVHLAHTAGARYIISPDVNPQTIHATLKAGMVSLPGCLTPSEITLALNAGADFIKVFPAGAMGASYIKALRAPLGHAPMLAVGGVNEHNAADFINAGCCGVGVGGNLVNESWIAQGAFDRIEALARSYISAVNP